MNPRVAAVARKELREFRRNKFVVGTMVVLPIVFLVVPVTNTLAVKISAGEAVIRATVGGAMLLFFMIPLILPTTLSAYAVVGEREQGTLEPVLTTPLRREEYILGKAIAVLFPSTAIAWALFAVYIVVVRINAIAAVVDLVWRPGVVIAEAIFAPLLATFSIWVGLAFSVRSSDVRAAQQLAGLAMLPLVGLSALFTFRVIQPTWTTLSATAMVLAALDAIGWFIVSSMFDRERLLTRFAR